MSSRMKPQMLPMSLRCFLKAQTISTMGCNHDLTSLLTATPGSCFTWGAFVMCSRDLNPILTRSRKLREVTRVIPCPGENHLGFVTSCAKPAKENYCLSSKQSALLTLSLARPSPPITHKSTTTPRHDIGQRPTTVPLPCTWNQIRWRNDKRKKVSFCGKIFIGKRSITGNHLPSNAWRNVQTREKGNGKHQAIPSGCTVSTCWKDIRTLRYVNGRCLMQNRELSIRLKTFSHSSRFALKV